MNIHIISYNTYILIRIQVYSSFLSFKLADKTNIMQNFKATITSWPKFVSNIY